MGPREDDGKWKCEDLNGADGMQILMAVLKARELMGR